MKRTIIMGMLFLCYVAYPQINNNWQLGSVNLDFNSNPATVNLVSGIPSGSNYGLASVSDENGNLLFYTNGVKVWNKNHSVLGNMTDINYNFSKAIIVPHPGDHNKYFIIAHIWEEILCGGCETLGSYGYAIVDFSNNSLGELLEINNNNGSYCATGVCFYSNYVNQIGSGYISGGRPLTAVFNENENKYWVIIQDNEENKILSFNIDTVGFNETPVVTSFSYSINIGNRHNVIYRITPDRSKLGGLTYNFDQHDQHYTGSEFFTLNFNIQTGQFSNYQSINLVSSWGFGATNSFEFSNDSEKVYFSMMKHQFNSNPDVYNGEILVKTLINPSLSARRLNLSGTSTPSSSFAHLQRDRHGNLLVSSPYTANDRRLYLHRIENQNSFSNSSIQANYLYLNGSSIGVMPQLIPGPSCKNELFIAEEVLSGQTDIQSAQNSITATNIINGNAIAKYDAGESVYLKPGFHSKSGSDFRAYIDGCEGKSSMKGKIINENKMIFEDIPSTKELIVFPNPVIETLSIESKDKMDNWVLIDISGNKILNNIFKNEENNNTNINLVDLPKGVYYLTVFFKDSDMITKTIIKK